MNDLAVAYLEQAQRDQDLQPMLQALDLIDRAVAQDSTLTSAWFNRALIRQRMYLIKTAHDTWAEFLAVDSISEWRTEAQQQQRVLAQQLVDTSKWSLSWLETAPAQDIRARVRQTPNAARDSCFGLVLSEWGHAIVRSDSTRAVRMF
ncbi:MAG: hypothetical protein ACREMA_19365, partial [Longimicrobiales bacterium]